MRGRPLKNIIPYDKHESVVYDYLARHTSIDALAKQYNVTTYYVRQILARANVPIKTRGQPKRRASDMRPLTTDNLADPLGDEVVTLLP